MGEVHRRWFVCGSIYREQHHDTGNERLPVRTKNFHPELQVRLQMLVPADEGRLAGRGAIRGSPGRRKREITSDQ